ncbi:endolytic transglycosylase MltG [Candidatus Avelusimicrobium aviculae]|uniref:endolytic transglycosylase MltG n=1 Tax=Candidatus Avelusimicrobium aviculae TaxID=3416206 RepID=UPI003D10F1C0
MKRLLIFFLICFLFLISVLWLVKMFSWDKGELITFTIRPGQSGAEVAQELKEAGIIKNPLAFRILLRLTSSAKDLKAGKFDLRKNTPSFEVINCIKSGRCTHYERLTVLEGWRSEEIAEALSEKGITDGNEFLSIVRERNLEGKLYPSTYLFSEDTPAQKVVAEMTAQYEQRILPLFLKYPSKLSEKEILTLASIVEREAIHHDERPKIAAVYLNRLKIGKRLEADPTVQYALGFNTKENRYWKKALTYKDLKTKSPYNTYRNAGLPPGPICNPSYESILGVLNPEPNFDNLYFVADNTGRHVFSPTFDQHKRNIRRIRGLE